MQRFRLRVRCIRHSLDCERVGCGESEWVFELGPILAVTREMKGPYNLIFLITEP
jgi:hypothetical protein